MLNNGVEQLAWMRWRRLPNAGREAVGEARNALLRGLVQDAAAHVPYFRRMLREAGIEPGRIRSPEDLRLLPVSQKSALRQLPASDLLSDRFKARRLARFATTGSTGVPFAVFKSSAELRAALVLRLRVARYFGLRVRDRVLRLTAEPPHPWYWRALESLGLYPGVPASLLEPPERLAEIVRQERPAVILGNAGVITMIAQEISHGAPLEEPPRFVICGAEVLTSGMRQKTEQAFRCSVFDSYSCVETMHPVAWQCRKTGLYHVCDDALILEVLRDGNPVAEGDEGEAVVTSLVSHAMPVIRYAQGDLVARGPSPCPCGSPFSTLISIRGRMTDYLLLPGGRRLFASSLAYVFHRTADWILRYELVQESISSVILRASVLRSPLEAEVAQLIRECSRLLSKGVEMRVELVERLEGTPGTKFRVLRSCLESPYSCASTGASAEVVRDG